MLRARMWWLRMRRSPQAWYELHARAFADYYDAEKIGVNRYWRRRVDAQHGLIAHGASSISCALEMLRSPNADIREDGAGVLAGVARNGRAVQELLAGLEREEADQPRDAIIQALGRMGDKRAIPYLAAIVEDPAADGDTRRGAADALGRLVGRSFDKAPDPVAAAIEWLDARSS